MSVIARTVPNRLNGIPFMDVTQKITSGQVFWVDSATGSDGGHHGLNPHQPFATIDYAIGKCASNKGDVIYVMPGHAETLAAASAITIDVAGISIIGLGNELNRPLLTFSATTSTIVVTAQNVLVQNLQFTSAINNLRNFITVSACNFTIEDCFFYTASTLEAYCFINITTTYDFFTCRRCRFWQPTDPEGTDAEAITGVFYFVDSEHLRIEDCEFYGLFETAIFHNKTSAAKDVMVKRCYGYNTLATSVIGELVEGMTGGDIGSLYVLPHATDVTTAQLYGTESTGFFIASYFGNDSGGGQGAVFVTAAT